MAQVIQPPESLDPKDTGGRCFAAASPPSPLKNIGTNPTDGVGAVEAGSALGVEIRSHRACEVTAFPLTEVKAEEACF